jgi:hypothetical protein
MRNPWKDKSLIMGLKLGDISPLAGVISGEGMYGKLADKGLMGLAPRMIASKAQEKDEAKAMQVAQAQAAEAKALEAKKKRPIRSRPQQSSGMGGGMEGYKAMKKGGKVSSASARADGCAIKGKTKGRMI